MFRLTEGALLRSGGGLRSAAFDDIYFQGDSARAETEHVFLAGLDGADGWLFRQPRLRLLEVGFGTGSNFLLLLEQFARRAAPDSRLIYCGIEGFPVLHLLEAADLAAAGPFAEELRRVAPAPLAGIHSRSFLGGRVILRLLYGPADFWQSRLTGRFDGLLLDGFAPSRNPALWSPELLAAISARVRPGGRLATFTVARPVRDALTAAGWRLTKRPGFGRKRECLVGERIPDAAAAPVPRHLQIAGAGVAGALVAEQAVARGLMVHLADPAGIGQGASGNPLALVDPRLSLDPGAAGRLRLAALLAAQHYYDRRGLWQCAGVTLRPSHALPAVRLQRWCQLGLPADWLVWQQPEDEGADEGSLVSRLGGSLQPAAVLARALAGWRTSGEPLLASAEAFDPALPTVDCRGWLDPLTRANRGQLTLFADSRLVPPRCREGYVASLPAPAAGGGAALIAGASYRRLAGLPAPADWLANPADDADNRRKASAALGQPLRGDRLASRVAFRATTPDQLPILGLLDGRWRLSGLGSRGFTWAPILADALLSALLDEPGPLDSEQLALLRPDRPSLNQGQE